MLLLDQGLPRSATHHLQKAGIAAVHAGEIGMSTADDATILDHARKQNQIVVTLDTDFHMRLALAGATRPSVIRIRREGLRGEQIAQLLTQVMEQCRDDLERGAVVSITETGIRVRNLPLPR